MEIAKGKNKTVNKVFNKASFGWKCFSRLIYRWNILYHKKEIRCTETLFKKHWGQNIGGWILGIDGKSFCVLGKACRL